MQVFAQTYKTAVAAFLRTVGAVYTIQICGMFEIGTMWF